MLCGSYVRGLSKFIGNSVVEEVYSWWVGGIAVIVAKVWIVWTVWILEREVARDWVLFIIRYHPSVYLGT